MSGYKHAIGKLAKKDQTLLSREIAKRGFAGWTIVVLERFTQQFKHVDAEMSCCKEFKKRTRKGTLCFAAWKELVRAKREKYWSWLLGSWAPHGLNNQRFRSSGHVPRYSNKVRPPRPFVRRFRTSDGKSRPNPQDWEIRPRVKVLARRKRIFGSRDYMRRLKAMLFARLSGRFHSLFLRPYRKLHLLRVYRMLDSTPLKYLLNSIRLDSKDPIFERGKTNHLVYIKLAINTELERRSLCSTARYLRKVNKVGQHELIVGGFTDALLDHAQFNRIAKSDLVRSFIPSQVRKFIKPPTISYKYGSTLKSFIGNEHCFAKKSLEDIRKISQSTCVCHKRAYASFCHSELGHVATCDPAVVQSRNLEKCLDLGLKHRFDYCEELLEDGQENLPLTERLKLNMSTAVQKYTTRLAEWLYVQHNVVADLSNYSGCLKAKLGEALDAIVPSKRHERLRDVEAGQEDLELQPEDNSHVRFLQRNFAFLETDKSNQDVAIVCKPLYAKWLLSELEEGDTYEKTDEPLKELVERHNAKLNEDFGKFLSKKRYEDVARFKGSLKFHKSPPKPRFIAGSGIATVKPISCLLNFIFGKMHPHVEEIWRRTLQNAGLRSNKSWIVQQTSEIAGLARELNRKHSPTELKAMHFETHDFSTLYTNLPHKDLIERISKLIDRIFAKSGKTHVRYWNASANDELKFCDHNAGNPTRGKEGNGRSKCFKFATAADIKSMLKYLIENTYVRLGETVFKQEVGIPIGTNCAVWLANWYLFTYELDFVERLIRLNKLHTLEKFKYTARYIDDVFSGGNPLFQEYAVLEKKQIDNENVGIYPAFLTLNRESGPGHMVHFLDVSLFYSGRSKRIETSIYSKRADPKFQKLRFIKYTHITSKIVSRSKYNTITSQFYRFVRNCSARRFFVYWMALLLRDLIERGYKPKKCLNTLSQVARKYMFNHHHVYCLTSFTDLVRLVSSRVRRFYLEERKKPVPRGL